jgi:hypothetical protein
LWATALLLCLSLAACRSAFVQTTILNQTGNPVRLIEVDYPSASFGTQQIANNAAYDYSFKIQGSGQVTISFTGDNNKIHTSTGPALTEGQQGSLAITLGKNDEVSWLPKLSTAK